MKTLLLVTAAAIALPTTSASATSRDRTPYQVVSTCLSEITVTYQGTVYRLRGNVHFQPMPRSDNPDAVFVPVVSLRAGLADHPAWKPRAADIAACVNRVPNTASVGRRN